MIGSALQMRLQGIGHEVVGLTRNASSQNKSTLFHWDPSKGKLDPNALKDTDGVVHLAGANIAQGRWTQKRKFELVQSRVESTKLLVESIINSTSPPAWMISASAIGIYGDRGDAIVDETTRPNQNFLGNLVTQWEEALIPLKSTPCRTATMRFGIVLSPKGGALKTMLPIFKLGGGAVLGSGNQWVSWISLRDVIGIIEMISTHPELSGAFNCVSPNPVNFKEFAKIVGKVIGKPVLLRIPMGIVRLIFGEMGEATLLSSCKAEPARLLKCGFKFQDPTLETALNQLLTK